MFKHYEINDLENKLENETQKANETVSKVKNKQLKIAYNMMDLMIKKIFHVVRPLYLLMKFLRTP